MSGKALRLIRSYLHKRHIQVVAGGESSLEKEIFSGVPQGAKWSPKLWNLDISEMPTVLGPEAIPFNYADDTGLLYVITESKGRCRNPCAVALSTAHLGNPKPACRLSCLGQPRATGRLSPVAFCGAG